MKTFSKCVLPMCMVLWGIWGQRNNLLWNGHGLTPRKMVFHALQFPLILGFMLLSPHDFQLGIFLILSFFFPHIRPLAGVVKCNCDAAAFL